MRKRTSLITSAVAQAGAPKWSKAYVDPESFYQSFVNPYALTIEQLDSNIVEIEETILPSVVDPDAHPWRAWVVATEDVANSDATFFDVVTEVIGTVSGNTIPLEIITNDNFLNARATAYYVSGAIDLSGNPGYEASAATFNPLTNAVYISYEGIDTHSIAGLPLRWGGEGSADLLFTDPLEITVPIDRSVPHTAFRIVLDRHVLMELSGYTATDVLQEKRDNDVTDDLSNIISLVDTSGPTWNTEKYNENLDFDKDGIIDQREIDEINAHVGKSRANFTRTEWSTLYSKYDINGDGIINIQDVNAVLSAKSSIRNKGTIVNFLQTGRWRFDLRSTSDGRALTSAFVFVDNQMRHVRGATFGILDNYTPPGCTQAVWHPYLEHFFMLNTIEHSIVGVKYNGRVVADSRKYPMPIRAPGSTVRGIALRGETLVVLRKDSQGHSLLMMDTTLGAIDSDIKVLPIHDTSRIDENIYVRDGVGLVDAHGLTFLGESRLATIDEGQLKVLLGIFDVATVFENDTGVFSLHMREAYESLETIPQYTVYPTFFHLFNPVDHFAFNWGLTRLPGEDNYDLKQRYMDVWTNFPGRDRQGIVYGIARELGTDLTKTYNQEQLAFASGDIGDLTSVRIFVDQTEVSGAFAEDDFTIRNQLEYHTYTKTFQTGALSGVVKIDNRSIVLNIED